MEQSVELEIQPYDWISSDRDNIHSIRIWAHTRDGPNNLNQNLPEEDRQKMLAQQVLIRIEDYLPFCRIELPQIVNGNYFEWDPSYLEKYLYWLKVCLNNHAPVFWEFRYLERLYYYKDRKTYPFLICYFKTEEAMKHCINLVERKPFLLRGIGSITALVREKNIPIIHKMITEAKIGYCQWIRVKAVLVPEEEKISYCQYEFLASYKELKSIPEEETKTWKVSPLVASFDIETYSSNHQAMPNRNFVSDIVFQCSVIFQRINHPETRKKYLLVVGSSGDIEGAEIINYDHEIKLIQGFIQLIKKMNPSILIGYNIFAYDIPYMDARLKLYLQEWESFSLIKDDPSWVKTTPWQSRAFHTVTVAPIKGEGRVCIDLYLIIRREYKLDRYTLNHVSSFFLGETKHDVTSHQMFEWFAEFRLALENYEKKADSSNEEALNQAKKKIAKIGEYCLQDAALCINLFEKLNLWIMLTEIATIVCVTLFETFAAGQQLRVRNQVYQYVFHEGFVIDDRAGEIGLKGAQVYTPTPGLYKNILIFDFASLYPSIIRAYNICYTTLVPPNSNISDEDCNIISWSEVDSNKKSPTFGETFHYKYRFIKKEKFHGILPRLCDHLVTARSQTRKMIKPENDPVYNIILNQRQNGLKITANSIFGSLAVPNGKLTLVEGARSITAMGRILTTKAGEYVESKYKGKIVYGDTDSIMVDLGILNPLDCLKYGKILSAEISQLYPNPIKLEFERGLAIAIFFTKKRYSGIPLAIKELSPGDIIIKSEFKPEYYDPSLVLYKLIVNKGDKSVTSYLGIPKSVAFPGDRIVIEESGGSDLLYKIETLGKPDSEGSPESQSFPGPKTIAGIPFLEGGCPDEKELIKKGIILARRDNCVWAREVYSKVLLSTLFNKPLDHTLKIIDQEILKLMSRQVPFTKLLITRTIQLAYKPNSTHPLKLFSDELRRIGYSIQPGDRIDYVLVRNQDPERNIKQGYKMRPPDLYWANYEKEPIDYLYYIEKQLKNPIQQLLSISYQKELDEIEKRLAPQVKRRNKIYTYISKKYIETWIKLISLKENLVSKLKDRTPRALGNNLFLIYL